MRAVAIEGPCCAGKTTLADGLVARLGAERTLVIPDYADFVGGGMGMPDPEPKTVRDELVALDALLVIEADRFVALRDRPTPPPLLLIDRSVLTLLGHCVGLERKNSYAERLLDVVRSQIEPDARCVWPGHVLYLDVDHGTQLSRNPGKFAPDSVFMDPAYNQGFRAYFERYRCDHPGSVSWLDGTDPPETILTCALDFLAPLLATP